MATDCDHAPYGASTGGDRLAMWRGDVRLAGYLSRGIARSARGYRAGRGVRAGGAGVR